MHAPPRPLSRPGSALPLAVWLTTALGATGCLLPPSLSGDFPCAQDSDCVRGWFCDPARGVCVEGEPPVVVEGDAGRPRTDAGSPLLDGGDQPPLADAGHTDGGASVDAGPTPDAGGEPLDAGAPADAGVQDGGAQDAGPVDAGVQDAGPLPPTFQANDDDVTTDEDTSITIDVLANDLVAPDAGVVVIDVSEPQAGTVEIADSGASVLFTPAPDNTDVQTFSYTIEDATGATASAQVTVTITPINDPPVAHDALYFLPVSATEQRQLSMTLTGTDPDGDPLTYAVETQPAFGSVDPSEQDDNVFIYTALPSTSGSVTFTFTATDTAGVASSPATVTIRLLEKTWTGAANEYWNVNENWLPVGIPNNNQGVFIPAGVSPAPTSYVNTNIRDLYVEEGATLNITGGDLRVSGHVRAPPVDDPAGGGITAGGGTLQLTGPEGTLAGQLGKTRITGTTTVVDESSFTGVLEIMASGRLEVNAQTLHATQGLRVAVDQADAGLAMITPLDIVYVDGTFTAQGNGGVRSENLLLSGELHLRGNLEQFNDRRSFSPQGTRVIFEGDGTSQTINIANADVDGSYLGDVDIVGSASVSIISTRAVITGRLNMDSTARLSGNELWYNSQLPFTAPGYTVTNSRVVGEIVAQDDLTLHGVNWEVPSPGRLILNGHTLSVSGNLTLSPNNSDEGLWMQDPDVLTIQGDVSFNAQNGVSTRQALAGGQIRLFGNFTQTRGSDGFAPSGTRVVFARSDGDEQTINFDDPERNDSYFRDIHLVSGANVRVLSPKAFVLGVLTMEAGASLNGPELYFDNEVPLTVPGYNISRSYLSGPQLELSQNRTLHGGFWELVSGGALAINGFTLTVLGNFTQTVENTNQGLLMHNGDVVVIEGVATFQGAGNASTSERFLGGRIDLHDDFIQTGGEETFVSAGTLLRFAGNGDNTQQVNIEDTNSDQTQFWDVEIAAGAKTDFARDGHINGGLTVNGELTISSGRTWNVGGDITVNGKLNVDGNLNRGGAIVIGPSGDIEGRQNISPPPP